MFHVLALICVEYVGSLRKEKELLSPKAHSGRESPLLLKGECTNGISISRFLVTFIYLCGGGEHGHPRHSSGGPRMTSESLFSPAAVCGF